MLLILTLALAVTVPTTLGLRLLVFCLLVYHTVRLLLIGLRGPASTARLVFWRVIAASLNRGLILLGAFPRMKRSVRSTEEWTLVICEVHPQFGLPVVPAMGPTLLSLILKI